MKAHRMNRRLQAIRAAQAAPVAPTGGPRAFGPADLDAFIRDVDAQGGPAALQGDSSPWARALYQPGLAIAADLDPFSEDYVAAQIALYREIAGHDLDQARFEMTDIDLPRHAAASNAYAQRDPSAFADHYLRLGNVVKSAALPPAARVLDMGAGWGMSSEFLALLGCDVTAVDINPLFVNLITQRAQRLGLPITAHQGTFDAYEPQGPYDAVLFYECLHHAVRPWTVIARMADALGPKGVFMAAGEPINDFWPHWGLRRDPLSIYCIRKYGWFESGWSAAFLRQCLNRAGLDVQMRLNSDLAVGWQILARRGDDHRDWSPLELASRAVNDGWFAETDYLVARKRSEVDLWIAPAQATVEIDLFNFRLMPVGVEVLVDGAQVLQTQLPNGPGCLRVPVTRGTRRITFVSDVWRPSQEVGNVDGRRMSFHITRARITI